MAESGLREYAQSRGIHRRTVDRWLSWAQADRSALEEIAVGLKISENHLRELMDWLEEIVLRDNASISEILSRPAIRSIQADPRFGRSDKLKRIKEQLRQWRFPRLTKIEGAIRVKIKQLKLPADVRLSVPAGLEGGRLKLEFNAGSAAELKNFLLQLVDIASSTEIEEIFDLLAGRGAMPDANESQKP